ncbi:MAG: hypothetical protein Q9218_007241 [Villophora microphyllina]
MAHIRSARTSARTSAIAKTRGKAQATDSNDEFGAIDDDEILLAESTARCPTKTLKHGINLSASAHNPPTKKVKTDAASTQLAHRILQKTWGFSNFRLKQEAVIARLISGGSAVVIFPTGGGKSLVYQIPALAFDEYDKHCGLSPGGGVTLVVSPLIALMKDQVDALRKRGVSAAAMDSTQSREAWLDTTEKLRNNTLKLFLRLLAESYTTENDKVSALQDFLRHQKNSSIVYVQTHKQTEDVCASLKKIGLNAYAYHAGMANDIRTSVQELFMKTKKIIIVATIAFGMGIDKPDIRNIVHFSVPKSLEGYSQEIGRAGRDGLESTCLIYLCAEDLGIIEQWSRGDLPSLRSLQGLIGQIQDVSQNTQPGDVLERNTNDESREWDIRLNALGLLNAQLELRFELIRAITPKYAQYKYKKSPTFDIQTSDGSTLTNVLQQVSKTAKTWTQIDVDLAAREANTDRALVVRKLQEWHNNGAIELQPSGVINRFRVLKGFPQGQIKRDVIVSALHTYFEASEKDAMIRVHNVIDLLTARACFSRGLARHFGDETTVPAAGCGHCSYCITRKPVSFDRTQKRSRKGHIDKVKFSAVLAATKVRDDPRFLARVAFGISSPRVTMDKLGKHPVFGSMDECDFEELVDRFRQAFTCFLKLPLELRQNVYRSYFSTSDLTSPFSVSPLLLCSCQIHDEAQQFFWQNATFNFRSTKTMVDYLTSMNHDILCRLRHIAVRGYPFPCYPDVATVDEQGTWTTYTFQNVLPLFPGLQLSTLRVRDPYHTAWGSEDGWAHGKTHYAIADVIESQGFKELIYIVDNDRFLKSMDATRTHFLLPARSKRDRDPQPSTWDAVVKKRDGADSGVNVTLYRLLDEGKRRVELKTDFETIQDFDRTINPYETPPDPGQIEIRIQRGRGTEYAQEGEQFNRLVQPLSDLFKELTWKEIKEKGLNLDGEDDPCGYL